MTEAGAQTKYLVIVVEDEVIIRMVAGAALTNAGFDVVEARHAEEAIAILGARARDVHAMFTDVHLPGSMDGLALAHLTHGSWPQIAVLIASGHARPRPEELPEGSRFLSKPYDLYNVVAHLKEMVTA